MIKNNHSKEEDVAMVESPSSSWKIYFESEELRNNRAFVLDEIREHPWKFEHTSEALRNDRAFLLEVVRRNGRAFKYGSKALRNDRALILEAVKNYGPAIGAASEALRNDRAFVLEAIRENGMAITYAYKVFRNDISLWWQISCCTSRINDDYRQGYVKLFFLEEFMNFILGSISLALGVLLLSEIIVPPIPVIACMIVGGCFAAMGSLHMGNTLYQDGLGFFNSQSDEDDAPVNYLQADL